MRLCVAIPCFFRSTPFEEAIETVASLGYDAAETYDWTALHMSSAKAALEKNGVELLSMCTTEFRMTDPAYRTEWLRGLRESCRAARELRVKRLITQVGPDTGAPREEQRRAIVETLRLAIPILEEYGVTLMPEPLNTLVDHKGYYLTAAAEAFSILREVDHPLVRLVFDIYHQQISEGNILPNLLPNLPLVAHLHAAGHPGRLEPWLGESDYRVILSRLSQAGYAGACGLEYRPSLDPIESLRLARELYGGEHGLS